MKPKVYRTQDGRLFMVVCPKCLASNPVLCIPSGVCDHCGYVAEEGDVSK